MGFKQNQKSPRKYRKNVLFPLVILLNIARYGLKQTTSKNSNTLLTWFIIILRGLNYQTFLELHIYVLSGFALEMHFSSFFLVYFFFFERGGGLKINQETKLPRKEILRMVEARLSLKMENYGTYNGNIYRWQSFRLYRWHIDWWRVLLFLKMLWHWQWRIFFDEVKFADSCLQHKKNRRSFKRFNLSWAWNLIKAYNL